MPDRDADHFDKFPTGAQRECEPEQSSAEPRPKAKAAIYAPTVFHEPWWLDVASNGTYREATVTSGGRLMGRLPYIQKRRVGVNTIGMPMMTHVLGPAIAPVIGMAGANQSLKQIAVTGELLAQLPKDPHVFFRLHGGINNAIAFQMNGFATTVQFTVEVKPDDDEALWRQMRDKTRNIIRRAEERLTVASQLGAEDFVSFYENNLRERDTVNTYDRDISIAIISECLKRNAGQILTAANAQGDCEAAIFVVWNEFRAHYLMSTRTLTAHSGAVSLLIWVALRQAASRGLVFDMDGIHVRGNSAPNILLLTGFGGTVEPRYCVSRKARWLQVGQALQNLLLP